jgi:hypothetical protein
MGDFFTDFNGMKRWYDDEQRSHREDGPAYIEYLGGSKFWYIHGRLHREDGPAIEYFDGTKEWYYHGRKMSCKNHEEFARLMRMKAFW